MAKPPASAAGRRRRAGRTGLLSLLLVALLAGLTILAGALIPQNGGWRPPARGITIFVATNGVHTGIVLPASGFGVDWTDLVRPEHLRDPRRAGSWLLFGWGERDFYLHTPRWRDVSVPRVLRAAAGSDRTLVHVQHLRAPAAGADMRQVVLSRAQFIRLARAIRSDFALDARGRPRPLAGYGDTDAFYAAHGRYSAIMTCNQWTRDRLAGAGVRIGRWTPLSWGVMRWFPVPAVDEDLPGRNKPGFTGAVPP